MIFTNSIQPVSTEHLGTIYGDYVQVSDEETCDINQQYSTNQTAKNDDRNGPSGQIPYLLIDNTLANTNHQTIFAQPQPQITESKIQNKPK